MKKNKEHVDPVFAAMRLFTDVTHALSGSKLPRGNTKAFETVRNGVLGLLALAKRLNQIRLDTLELDGRLADGLIKDGSQDDRQKLIRRARKRVRATDHVSVLVSGMDTVHAVFESMHMQFAYGLMPSYGMPDADRYTCAALLPAVVSRLENKWPAVRNNAMKLVKKSLKKERHRLPERTWKPD